MGRPKKVALKGEYGLVAGFISALRQMIDGTRKDAFHTGTEIDIKTGTQEKRRVDA